MKKLITSCLLLISAEIAYALPVGNPLDPLLLQDGVIIAWEGCTDPFDFCDPSWDFFSLRFGYYGDFVFERHLRIEDREDIQNSELYTNAGLAVINVCNFLDIYGIFGGTNALIDTSVESFDIIPLLSDRVSLETDTDFCWGVGVKILLWEYEDTAFGIDGRYFKTKPSIRRISNGGLLSVYPDNFDMNYQEWQVGIGLAHEINIFVPYIAAKWSQVDVTFDEAPLSSVGFLSGTLFNLKNHKHWGYVVGVSIVDFEMMSLNAEARFRDELALAVNAQIRF